MIKTWLGSVQQPNSAPLRLSVALAKIFLLDYNHSLFNIYTIHIYTIIYTMSLEQR